MRREFLLLFILCVLFFSQVPTSSSAQQPDETSNYFTLAIEATDWITEFQFTPMGSSWGTPYNNSKVWGLDPFVYVNGTITGGYPKIPAGGKQTLGYLIGGHDSGEAASAALEAYLHTHNEKYLHLFQVYLDYFKRSQMPSRFVYTDTVSVHADKNVTLDNSGYFAEQVNIDAGPDSIYGTADDDVRLVAVFPAVEHGNPIAYALVLYYKLTKDPEALDMLKRYDDWLIRSQIKEGDYVGALPVTQYHYHIAGWKPRMFETTQSAWILAEIYSLTEDEKFLEAAERTVAYMLQKQYTKNNNWNDTKIVGALPYEWRSEEYNPSVLTNHAGYTLMAWFKLYELTGKEEYLDAAANYADWLLSM